jgi:hypothetical protein
MKGHSVRGPLISVRGWLAIGAAATAAVIVANHHYVVGPRMQREAAIGATARAEATQNRQLQARVDQLQAKESEIGVKALALTAVASAIPPGPQEAQLTDTIAALASGDHIRITKFSPGVPGKAVSTTSTSGGSGVPTTPSTTPTTTPAATGSADYQSIPIALGVSGTYPDVARFIKDLETSSRLFTISSAVLSPASPLTATTPGGQSGGTITAELTANAFYTSNNLTTVPAAVSALIASRTPPAG